MKRAILHLSVFVSVIFILNGLPANSQELEYAGRKWYEWNNTLFRIAAEPESLWKEAHVQCKKEKMQLIRPESNGIELQYFIKATFQQFPSFWAENNATDKTFMEKLGFKKGGKGRKCNKLDRKTFDVTAEDCNKELGFICETTLRNDTAEFRAKNTKYFIQPQAKFYCKDAREECAKRNMSMVLLNPYKSHVLLNDFIFLRYGSKPTFWFARSNTTHECLPWTRLERTVEGAQHGFVCETTVIDRSFTFRHLVLIVSVSIALILSIIVFVIVKCCFGDKTEEHQHDIQHEKK